ncbi:MAG: esterase, hydrolase [Acidobacteria bacterium]|nr:MAG: esterase, hydrolase [Acidobacteriota bacterium]
MNINKLEDGSGSFDVSVRRGKESGPVVLFAVGAGGDPERHVTLFDALAESGCTVIAPHFPRLSLPRPTESELTLRARRLCLVLDVYSLSGATVSGVGHSIGAATLIALAGGQMWLGPGQRVHISADVRLSRLALLAPPTGFFQAPGAPDSVRVPILTWVGSEDDITPPSQIV